MRTDDKYGSGDCFGVRLLITALQKQKGAIEQASRLPDCAAQGEVPVPLKGETDGTNLFYHSLPSGGNKKMSISRCARLTHPIRTSRPAETRPSPPMPTRALRAGTRQRKRPSRTLEYGKAAATCNPSWCPISEA